MARILQPLLKIIDYYVKRVKLRIDIILDKGMAFELPYPDNSFDRVVSSLVFHHLTLENKKRSFDEIYRVLKPGGELHAADFGKPQNIIMYLPSLILRHFENASENIKGLLPEMFRSAGFTQVEETARFMTMIGTLSLYRAIKPHKNAGTSGTASS